MGMGFYRNVNTESGSIKSSSKLSGGKNVQRAGENSAYGVIGDSSVYVRGGPFHWR